MRASDSILLIVIRTTLANIFRNNNLKCLGATDSMAPKTSLAPEISMALAPETSMAPAPDTSLAPAPETSPVCDCKDHFDQPLSDSDL